MNVRNIVNLIGYFPDQEKMGKSVMYKEGDGEKKKSFYRGKLSVKRAFKTKDGDNKYDFIPFTAFGHNADFIHQYVNDGDVIAIQGEIQISENYEDKEGNTVYGQPFVLVDAVSVISSKSSESKSEGNSKSTSTKTTKSSSGSSNPLAKLRNRAK
jgi:single-stranded DNA-binding protein